MFEDNDLSEQQVAAIKMLACYDEILQKTHQTSVLDFLKSTSGTHALPPVLLDTGDDNPD
jgi:hypothetical protein